MTMMLFNDLLLFSRQKRSSSKLIMYLHTALSNVLLQEVDMPNADGTADNATSSSSSSSSDSKYALDVIVRSLGRERETERERERCTPE